MEPGTDTRSDHRKRELIPGAIIGTGNRYYERLSGPETDTIGDYRNREQIPGATFGTGNRHQERLSELAQIPGATMVTGTKYQEQLSGPRRGTGSDNGTEKGY